MSAAVRPEHTRAVRCRAPHWNIAFPHLYCDEFIGYVAESAVFAGVTRRAPDRGEPGLTVVRCAKCKYWNHFRTQPERT